MSAGRRAPARPAFVAGANVVPLRPLPLFERVVLMARDGAAHVFLAGPLLAGKHHPFRWMGAIPVADVERLHERVRAVAEKFGVDLIEDRSGCVDASRGPGLYSLSGGAA